MNLLVQTTRYLSFVNKYLSLISERSAVSLLKTVALETRRKGGQGTDHGRVDVAGKLHGAFRAVNERGED
ncbi:MAG: hypothetical protein AB1705_12570 [Verrucomicrobiota bacterium]